ncbi:MAG: NAD(P)-dependent oxidoreductase [Chloroflexota bacterium]
MALSVGYIGLGYMGKPMARNLLKAGFPLTVHNRSQAAVNELVAEGATAADSPKATAAQVEVLFSCLPGPADVAKVYLGENGVLAGARPGSVLVDMSTIDPGTHQKIAAAAAEKGIDYLDAPVSGGTTGARDGTLSIMVGGSAAALERVMPALRAMGQRIYHIGPVGHGAVVKIINNMMSAINAVGVSEGLVLGTKFGIDPKVLVEVCGNSSAGSRTLTGTSQAVLRRDFEPGFMIDLMHKDVGLAVELGKTLTVRTLAAALAEQFLQEAQGAGLGKRGTAAQIIPLERNAGVEVRPKE